MVALTNRAYKTLNFNSPVDSENVYAASDAILLIIHVKHTEISCNEERYKNLDNELFLQCSAFFRREQS